MKTCTRCGFTCKSGCPFTAIDGKVVCKKCAGIARQEVLAEIQHGQRYQGIASNISKRATDKVKLLHANNTRSQLRGVLAGRSVFLLCGGPSLATFDLSLLDRRGIVTMAINNAVALYRPTFWIGGDQPGRFIEQLWEDPGVTKFVPTVHRSRYHRVRDENGDLYCQDKAIFEMPNTWFFKREKMFNPKTFLESEGFGWGGKSEFNDTSGTAERRTSMLLAIKMLWYLGAGTVYLLGADFKMEKGALYAFEQGKSDNGIKSNNTTYKALNYRLGLLKAQFEATEFYLVNCTPDSGLKGFPYMKYEDAVKAASAKCSMPINTADMYDFDGDCDKQRKKIMPIKKSGNHNFDGKLAVVTCTRDRSKALALCQKYLERQTVKPDVWIVASEGIKPTIETALPLIHDHDPKPKIAGKYSLCRNIMRAVRIAKEGGADGVLIMEDDDWYREDYIEYASGLLNKGHVTSYKPVQYFHLLNGETRSSNATPFSQMGFKKQMFDKVIAIADKGVALIDKELWQAASTTRYFTETPELRCLSLKGMYGTHGVTAYHEPDSKIGNKTATAGNDIYASLVSYIGEDDAAAYKSIIEGGALKPDNEAGK